ncbi:MAG: 50S ribosomal protein L10 [Elusimicrobiota bacterium]|jgi:large subunit ribosomal protein L10
MKQTKAQKKEESKKFAETLKASPFLYFTDYQGLKFTELAELRAKLKPMKCRFKILKNSLLENALKQAGIDGVDTRLIEGPNAILVTQSDDPIGPAKVLAQFAKEFPKLKIKAGYVGRQWMSAPDCERLSKIGSRPELAAKLVGVLYSTVSQSASVLAAPIRDLVLVLKALEEKQQKSATTAA